jgi:hypothetical protein
MDILRLICGSMGMSGVTTRIFVCAKGGFPIQTHPCQEFDSSRSWLTATLSRPSDFQHLKQLHSGLIPAFVPLTSPRMRYSCHLYKQRCQGTSLGNAASSVRCNGGHFLFSFLSFPAAPIPPGLGTRFPIERSNHMTPVIDITPSHQNRSLIYRS